MTTRNNLHWGVDSGPDGSYNLSYAYTNNRVSGWIYDADGRVTASGEPEKDTWYTYDAAGQLIRSLEEKEISKKNRVSDL